MIEIQTFLGLDRFGLMIELKFRTDRLDFLGRENLDSLNMDACEKITVHLGTEFKDLRIASLAMRDREIVQLDLNG